MKKIQMLLNLHDWSNTLDYFQVTETLNLIFFYKKNPEKVPKKYHKVIDTWLLEKNLDKFISYKVESEKHQHILNTYNSIRQVTDQ